MSKTFLEVFPTLRVDEGLIGLLEKTEVTRVSANHDKSHIRIYLHAERLIEKNKIWYLESEIKKQLFGTKNITIKIIESYQLSGQYNAQTLMQVYKDSILEELNEYSILEYNLLRTADMNFETPSKMTLVLDDTIIAKTRGTEIVEFLEKVICERCGLDCAITTTFREAKESKYRKNAAEQIRQEVIAIMERTNAAANSKEGETAAQDGLLLNTNVEKKTTEKPKEKVEAKPKPKKKSIT